MTSDTPDLEALAARVEAAQAADRELDGWIHAHMTRGEPYVIGSKPGRFPQEPIYGERLDVMKQLSADPVGAAQYIGAPAYTASIDAALQLADEDTAAQALREAFSMIQMLGWPEGDFKGALARLTVATILRARSASS